VYLRNPDNRDAVAGIIEKVGARDKNAFLDLSELQEYLEHLIKTDESDYSRYSEARQIDMYG
jgi:hypothetical protein